MLLLLFAASLKVPEGFTVSLVAGHETANDIHCMTVVPDGRIVVAGRGYVRLLGADGKKLLDFAGAPKDGAMGLFWEKGDLYCVGDGGLKVWRDAEKGHAKPPAVLFKCKTGGEHTAHAVQRGPDGWMYLLVGDGTGITAKDITGPLSPVKEPVAGCVLRFSPDWKQCECYGHGFRNAYGMDFGCDGELYTFDSDNERCVGLPWYEGCRFYRVQCGGFHGWLGPKLASTWRMPPHFPDVVPPVKDLGRGSPTGVTCYRHAQFPEKYRGGFFLCDWTFGRILFLERPSEWRGVTTSFLDPKTFAKATGEEGFAPVASCVDPTTGDLLIAIGGRGTRGAVYRIRYAAGFGKADAKEVAKLQPQPRTLDWDPKLAERMLGWSDDRRLQQEYALRHIGKLTPEQKRKAYRNGATMFGILRPLASRVLAALPEKERKELVTKDPGEWELGTEHLAFPSWESSRVVARARVNADVRLDA
ncbi:MAG: hypothetical protein K2W96_01720, partial [Gemmataceae bacterium]|nr:hypothetical protein [Gemmataceae bacterium]